jgi:hypothetical protein
MTLFGESRSVKYIDVLLLAVPKMIVPKLIECYRRAIISRLVLRRFYLFILFLLIGNVEIFDIVHRWMQMFVENVCRIRQMFASIYVCC